MNKLVIRFVSVFIMFLFVFGMLPISDFGLSAQAAEPEFMDEGFGSNGKFLAPIGSPVNGAIPVSSVEDLLAIRSNRQGIYYLTNDIDLSGIEWIPIGTCEMPFVGTFDGQGHIIKNLTITGMDSGIFNDRNDYGYYSLFGVTEGNQGNEIRNLGIEDVNIRLSIHSINSHLTIVVCPVSSKYSFGPSGLGWLRNCYTTGNIEVTVSAVSEYQVDVYATGLTTSVIRIEDCYNLTDIDIDVSLISSGGSGGSGSCRVSAFGLATDSGIRATWEDYVARSFNAGNISVSAYSNSFSSSAGAGGISASRVSNAYNAGNISATSHAVDTYPDYAGRYYAYASSSVSGITTADNSGLNYSYNTGVITSSSTSNATYVNGGSSASAVSWGMYPTRGASNSAALADSVFASAVSLHSSDFAAPIYNNNDGRFPDNKNCISIDKSTVTDLSFWKDTLGFNFDTIWKMPESGGFPIFKNQSVTGEPSGGDDGESDIEPKNIYFYSGIKESTTNVSVLWGLDYFRDNGIYSSRNYNPDLALASAVLSAAAYGNTEYSVAHDDYISGALRTLGLDVDDRDFYYNPSNPEDGIACAIAKKASDGFDLVVIVIRGTVGKEWYGDFNIGENDETHVSFENAKNTVQGILTLFKNNYNLGSGGRPIKYLVTGHSRGAAVANLLAKDLTDNFGASNVYAYTFATPNVTKKYNTYVSYRNIFNLVNAEDFVPFMPLPIQGWSYSKYGTTLAFPSSGLYGEPSLSTPLIEMQSNFTNITGKRYEMHDDGYRAVQNLVKEIYAIAPTVYDYYHTPQLYRIEYESPGLGMIQIPVPIYKTPEQFFISVCDALVTGDESIVSSIAQSSYEKITRFLIFGSGKEIPVLNDLFGTHFPDKIAQAHTPETYIAWLQATRESDLLGVNQTPQMYAKIACPVDIEIYNSANVLVGKTVNDVPVENLSRDVSIYVSGDVKHVYLPVDGVYSIYIAATGDGSMDYSIELYDVISGETETQKLFTNVTLTLGKKIMSEIGGNTDIPDIQLFALDQQGNKTAEINIDGTETLIHKGGNGNNPGSGTGGGTTPPTTPSSSKPLTDTTVAPGEYDITTPEGQPPVDNGDGSVTLPGGGTVNTPGNVTIDVPPGTVINDGVKISFLPGGGGTITNSNGYTFEIPEDAIIILDANTPLGYYINLDNPFEDIKESDWFYDPVLFAYAHGLMTGTSIEPMLFSPNTTTTRGMIVTILYRLEGSPNVSGLANPFSDVPVGEWYTNAVIWAADNNIVAGIGDGKFAPETPITKQDMAVILMRYMNFKEIVLPVSQQFIIFADAANISDYAMDAIQTFNKLGIINGTGTDEQGQTIIDPKGNATRAQAATLLMNFLQVIEK